MSSERLQKIISAAGVASRRQAEAMILAGRVTVNGKVVDELGDLSAASFPVHVRYLGVGGWRSLGGCSHRLYSLPWLTCKEAYGVDY